MQRFVDDAIERRLHVSMIGCVRATAILFAIVLGALAYAAFVYCTSLRPISPQEAATVQTAIMFAELFSLAAAVSIARAVKAWRDYRRAVVSRKLQDDDQRTG